MFHARWTHLFFSIPSPTAPLWLGNSQSEILSTFTETLPNKGSGDVKGPVLKVPYAGEIRVHPDPEIPNSRYKSAW